MDIYLTASQFGKWLRLATSTSVNNCYLFSDSPPVPPSERHQTRVSFEQNAFPVCCRNKKRNFTTNLKQAVPEIHEEGDEVRG